MTDEFFIRMCLRLARRGTGQTNPNPMVGAVLVRDGKIIGSGFHRRFGSPHAEVEAIRSAHGSVDDATLYVNLEPCCHTGKTPPCTDAIISAGITRVICAMQDPNPQVSGNGFACLRNAGIDVQTGILETDARHVNEAFITYHEKKRPFVAIKFAASLDGKIATKTGDSKWITDEKARAFARSLRGGYQAVLVGINTILADNPHLGTRIRGKRDPLRIILDSRLRIPLGANMLRDTNVLLITSKNADKEKMAQLTAMGIPLLQLNETVMQVPTILSELYNRGVISILVEGGGGVLGSFTDAILIDKVYAFHSPVLIGGRSAVSAIEGEGSESIATAIRLTRIQRKIFTDSMLTIGYPI